MTSYEARVETYDNPADLPKACTVIITADRAELGAWLRREAAAIEPARVIPDPAAGVQGGCPSVRLGIGGDPWRPLTCTRHAGHPGLHRGDGTWITWADGDGAVVTRADGPAGPSARMVRTAAAVRTPPAVPCSEAGCALLFGHRGFHVPRMLGPLAATYGTGDDDAQWLHGPEGPFAEAAKARNSLREVVAQRDKTLDELQRTRQQAARLADLLAEARRTALHPGEVRIAAGAARTALDTLGRMRALTDDEDERWAYRNAHRHITAALDRLEGPASPLSATESQDQAPEADLDVPAPSSPHRPSQAGGVWGSYVDYLAALERVYEAARAWRTWVGLPVGEIYPSHTRALVAAVDAFSAPGDFPDDREPASGGAAAVLEVVEAARAWRSTYSKADFRNNAPRSRLAKAVDALDGIKATDYVVGPEWADAARQIGWAAGVRWAAAEADAQARAGATDSEIFDVTDHLRLCADDPGRDTAVPRDQAPGVRP